MPQFNPSQGDGYAPRVSAASRVRPAEFIEPELTSPKLTAPELATSELATSELTTPENILASLPPAARHWAESLPWEQRRYMLSLCHLMRAAAPEVQAEFLDDYTADGIVSKVLSDRDTQRTVKKYLDDFRLTTDLDEVRLRGYIKQFYIHTAQDTRRQPDLYLESALKLVMSTEERNSVFNYILGFELIKMLFQMSWYEHEKLYRLQRSQDEFIHTYIKPIQHTHRINQLVVPRDADKFFARRDYYVQRPVMSARKLVELAIATFTTEVTIHLGFSIIRHAQALVFDYDLIFGTDPEGPFI